MFSSRRRDRGHLGPRLLESIRGPPPAGALGALVVGQLGMTLGSVPRGVPFLRGKNGQD
jgi:hypothetical protein